MTEDRRRGAICGTHETFTVVSALQCPVCALERAEARVKELAEKWTHDMKEAGRRIKELEVALREYGWHKRECATIFPRLRVDGPRPCNCGVWRVLRGEGGEDE